jgi:ParB family chromosome partitioning protein
MRHDVDVADFHAFAHFAGRPAIAVRSRVVRVEATPSFMRDAGLAPLSPTAGNRLSLTDRIIDGERRWTNSRALVAQGRDQYRQVPVEITDRTLSDEERLRVWIYIHRQRKEWDAKEKEMVAYRLVDLVGPASAANILGITARELDKLVDVFELSERFTGLREQGGGITWARELMGVSKKLLAPAVIEAVIKKVGQKRITNSKDLRKLRAILPDPVARKHFLSDEGDLDSAMLRLTGDGKKPKHSLAGELDAAVEAMKHISWTALEEMKGDADLLKKLTTRRRCSNCCARTSHRDPG